eukprot:TRINITY_DN4032_c0_g1_i1.p1 TRINITY_DN4032_c0_g1~~TRINITY_DN4032_c0_g1_i1.p1  ORF type:complete len:263 (+),score=43.77 TRINITY_DN4032_c0_g1_i1:2-790(+)
MALKETLWAREFELLQTHTQLMMDLHDETLEAFNKFYELDDYLVTIRDEVRAKAIRFSQKKEERELSRKHEEDEQQHNRFELLVELLSSEDLALVNAVSLTAGAEQGEILSSVIQILDAHKKTLPIIRLAIKEEVKNTKSASTLFRGNSVSTKLISAFTKMTGRQYLKCIQGSLLELQKDPLGYEVDPTKAKGQDVAANMVKLKMIVQALLDRIAGSVASCPIPFRAISNKLRTEVETRFPDAGITAVTGFIFLRFFCPAIL